MMKIIEKNRRQEGQGKTIILSVMIMVGVILLINFSSASFGVFKQNNCVQIRTISNSSLVNISSISYPNSTIAITNSPMTKVGSTFNYTFCNTSDLGIYIYDYYDQSGNVNVNDFKITYNGEDITIQQMYVYMIALFFIILLIFGLFWITTKLPSRDTQDEDSGMVIQINFLKHLRQFIFVFIFALGVACLFIISNIGLAYLQNQMIGKFFFVLYRIFFYVFIIGTPVSICLIFYRIYRDNKIKKELERGVEIPGKW